MKHSILYGDGQDARFEVTSVGENGEIRSVIKLSIQVKEYTFGTTEPDDSQGSNAQFYPIFFLQKKVLLMQFL